MTSEWEAVGGFFYLWAKECWNCMRACFALESTALGKCHIRAEAEAWCLRVFVMRDNLARTSTEQKTFTIGMSGSRFTSEVKRCSTREPHFLFESSTKALRALDPDLWVFFPTLTLDLALSLYQPAPQGPLSLAAPWRPAGRCMSYKSLSCNSGAAHRGRGVPICASSKEWIKDP